MRSCRQLSPCFLSFWGLTWLTLSTAVHAQQPATVERAAETAVEKPSEVLDEVGIEVARARRAPGSLHVIGRETLERYKYDDPHATLQLVPGVYVRQEDGFGLRPNIGIRGTLSDRSKKITLVEDGVLFGPAPYSAPAAYYFPIIGRMTQVKIVKGPSAISYGPQTVGGAIELKTRELMPDPSAGVELAGGLFGYGKFHGHATASTGRSGILIEGVHLRSDGFKQLPDGQDTGFGRNEWMLKGEHFLSAPSELMHRLSLKLTYSNEVSHETYLGLTDEDFRRDPVRRYGASQNDLMRWHRTSLVARHELQISPKLRLTTDVYRHDLDRSWNKVNHFAGASLFDVLSRPETPGNTPFYALLDGQAETAADEQQLYVGPNQRHYVSQGIQMRADGNWHSGPLTHHVQLGARLHYDRIRRRHSEDAFLLSEGTPVPVDNSTLQTTANRASTVAFSAHALDEIRWGDHTLTPGVRTEVLQSKVRDEISGDPEQQRGLLVVLGGLGYHYAFGDSWGVLAGVHRGMSPPAPGTENSVQPEISINYEAGARYLKGFRRAELIGYFNDYQNLTDVCTLSGGCDESTLDEQFDAGRARIYGVEALMEDTLLYSALRVPFNISYTLTRTEFLETFESRDPIFGDVEAGDELPYVPRHQARGSLGIELDWMGGYVAATYSSAMRERSGAGPLELTLATDSLLSLDAGVHYLPIEEVRIYAQVRNLLDQQSIVSRRPYGARPNAPRFIQLGVSYGWR